MARLDQAMRHLQAGRIAEAEKALRRFLKESPTHPAALFLYGTCLAQRGALVDAISFMERAVARDPKFGDARLGLARAYAQTGRIQEAEASARHAVSLMPQSAQAYTTLGVVLFNRNSLDEAENAFRAAVRLEPNQAQAHKNLGDVIWSAGREREAIEHHVSAIERWQGAPNETLFEHVWRMLTTLGETGRALAVCTKWLSLNPRDAVARHCMAASSGADTPGRASDGYVKGMFDQFASSFDEQLAAVRYCGPDLVAEALRAVSAQCVPCGLDGGCGTGLCGPLLRPFTTRLVGVDLSSEMLGRARARAVYDELVEKELTGYIEAHPASFDWIISADTLNYFGDLAPIARASMKALRSGGHLIFTVERGATPTPFALLPHGRYSHRPDYLEAVLKDAGFAECRIEAKQLRTEKEASVLALVVTASKLATP